MHYPTIDGTGYTVEIPDLKGLVTEGKTFDKALLMTQDAACGWILDEDDNNVSYIAKYSETLVAGSPEKEPATNATPKHSY